MISLKLIFLKVNIAVILKEVPRNTASPKLVRFRAWIIGAAQLTSEIVSRTSPSKSVSAIFQIWFGFFFYNLLKFDIVNADIPFYKRGHNSEELSSSRTKANQRWRQLDQKQFAFVEWNVTPQFALHMTTLLNFN